MNASLYRWLSAWFATVTVTTVEDHDPLRRDLLVLRRARETVAAVLARFPGLVQSYTALSAATASARPIRPLPRPEKEVERIVLALLGAAAPPAGDLWSAITGEKQLPERAPAGYQPFLPCPLWGDCWTREFGPMHQSDDNASRGADPAAPDPRKRFAVRQREDDAKAAIPSCSTGSRRFWPWPRW